MVWLLESGEKYGANDDAVGEGVGVATTKMMWC
jgi:hypothetical protein